MSPVADTLDKSHLGTAQGPCQASRPLVPAQECEKLSFCVILTTDPHFAARTWVGWTG